MEFTLKKNLAKRAPERGTQKLSLSVKSSVKVRTRENKTALCKEISLKYKKVKRSEVRKKVSEPLKVFSLKSFLLLKTFPEISAKGSEIPRTNIKSPRFWGGETKVAPINPRR